MLVGVVAISSSAVLIRWADAPSLSISFWRTIGGAAALAPFAWPHRRSLRGHGRTVLASGAALAAHFALWIGSLSFTTVASSVTLVTMSPLFVALGSAAFLDERATRRTWTGMAVTMAGAIAIGAVDATAVDLGARAVLGDLMALGGAVAASAYLLLGRSMRRSGVPNTVYGAAVYAVAAAILLPMAAVGGADLAGYDGPTWWALVGLVVGPQLLGHTVFNGLLDRLTATVVSITILAEPVGATLLAWWLLDELPPDLFWLGAPLILAGVFVATTGGRRRRPTEPPPV